MSDQLNIVISPNEVVVEEKASDELHIETSPVELQVESNPVNIEILTYGLTPSSTDPSGVIFVKTVDTTTAPILVDFEEHGEVQFRCNSPIAGSKTWSYINNTASLQFVMFVEFTGTPVQTFPNNTVMNDIRWDSVAKTFTPFESGNYRVKGDYNGTNWYLEVSSAPYI